VVRRLLRGRTSALTRRSRSTGDAEGDYASSPAAASGSASGRFRTALRILCSGLAGLGLLVLLVTLAPLVSWWAGVLAGPWEDPTGDVLIVTGGSLLADGVMGPNSYWRSTYARTGLERRVIPPTRCQRRARGQVDRRADAGPFSSVGARLGARSKPRPGVVPCGLARERAAPSRRARSRACFWSAATITCFARTGHSRGPDSRCCHGHSRMRGNARPTGLAAGQPS
jgi:hypothetical protein